MATDDRCHDTCKEKGTHSICHLAGTLKRPLLDQMIHKLETLPNKRQNIKRFAGYVHMERLYKGTAPITIKTA